MVVGTGQRAWIGGNFLLFWDENNTINQKPKYKWKREETGKERERRQNLTLNSQLTLQGLKENRYARKCEQESSKWFAVKLESYDHRNLNVVLFLIDKKNSECYTRSQ